MNKKKLLKNFYFITDHKISSHNNIIDAKLALQAQCKIIQLREKTRTTNELINEASAIRKLCRQYNALFIVNDNLKLAIQTNADGIHLGQNDNINKIAPLAIKANKILGISTHSVEEAIKAEKLGADYIAIGHIFPTTTKLKKSQALGTQIITELKIKIKSPIVAIGGINHNNAPSVINAGADMICAISNSLKHGTVKENIQMFMNLFKK